MTHLLSLAALHAEHPDAPSSVFGPDGDFEGAPRFTGPIYGKIRHEFAPGFYHVCTRYAPDSIGVMRSDGGRGIVDQPALDLRVPSIAARLAGLCCRAADPRRSPDSWQRAADLASRASRGEWDPEYAPALAALTLALAPRIATLRGAK